MDILLVFKGISFLATLGLLVFTLDTLHDARTRVYAGAMLGFFFLSTVLFGDVGESTMFNEWAKHGLFYTGQFFLFLFLKRFVSAATVLETSPLAYKTQTPRTLYAGTGILMLTQFFTKEGLQHVLAVPLLLVVIGAIRIQAELITLHEARRALNVFMLGATSLAMIHLGEFVVESQGIIPALAGDAIEIIEFLWFYLGIACFTRGFWLLRRGALVL